MLPQAIGPRLTIAMTPPGHVGRASSFTRATGHAAMAAFCYLRTTTTGVCPPEPSARWHMHQLVGRAKLGAFPPAPTGLHLCIANAEDRQVAHTSACGSGEARRWSFYISRSCNVAGTPIFNVAQTLVSAAPRLISALFFRHGTPKTTSWHQFQPGGTGFGLRGRAKLDEGRFSAGLPESLHLTLAAAKPGGTGFSLWDRANRQGAPAAVCRPPDKPRQAFTGGHS